MTEKLQDPTPSWVVSNHRHQNQRISGSQNAWKKSGCNSCSSNGKTGVSRPISLWRDEDIQKYISDKDVALSALYTQYEQKRTGCCNCPYGAHLDPSRFDLLKELQPKRYDHFMKTRLQEILLLSGVEIVSDSDYMNKLQTVQEIVRAWHEKAKGDDNYLEWKVTWFLSRYTLQDLKDCLNHLAGQHENNLFYPMDKILQSACFTQNVEQEEK